MRHRATVAAALALLTAGCTSAAADRNSPAPSSGPVTGSAPSSTGSGSSSPAPLSDMESYPVIQAMRQWTAAAGRAVNTGHATDAALDALMTTRATAQVGQVLARYVGSYLPGPLPFQPTGVAALDGFHQNIYGCAEIDGWAQDRTTHKPLRTLKVSGAQFAMVRETGPWQVDAFVLNPKISCSDVKVKAPTW